jgi:peptidoglycan/LPS O-acetylase OafA/YrhL
VHTTFPLNLVLAFGMALLSYHLLERPLLRLRSRFARVAPAADAVHPPAAAEPAPTRP